MGSRGDVQPFLPLSLALMAKGHSVKLAAPSLFKKLVEGYRIPFVPLAGDPEDLSRHLNDVGYNFIKIMRVIDEVMLSKSARIFCVKPMKPVMMPILSFILSLMQLAHIQLHVKRIFPIFTFKLFPCSRPQVIIPILRCLI